MKLLYNKIFLLGFAFSCFSNVGIFSGKKDLKKEVDKEKTTISIAQSLKTMPEKLTDGASLLKFYQSLAASFDEDYVSGLRAIALVLANIDLVDFVEIGTKISTQGVKKSTAFINSIKGVNENDFNNGAYFLTKLNLACQPLKKMNKDEAEKVIETAKKQIAKSELMQDLEKAKE